MAHCYGWHETLALRRQLSISTGAPQLSFMLTSPWSLGSSLHGGWVPREQESCQASLSITNSQSLLKLMSTESVMPSNHLILCRPLLLLPSVFPSIRVFSNESNLHMRWPKYLSPNSLNSREGNGTPLQYSCLENPMDRGAWKAAVHGVAKSRTRLSD